MTSEQSKQDYFHLLAYMEKNKMSDTLQNTVLGLISVIKPRETAYQALKEMLMFTKKGTRRNSNVSSSKQDLQKVSNKLNTDK